MLVSRYMDHLPFYGQKPITARRGWPFSRQTADGWALEVAERWLASVVDIMLEETLASGSLNTEDTA